MSNPTYTTRLAETLGSDALAELALDLRWSFNHAADAIWQRLDPVLWKLTCNPWFVLQTVSRARLEELTADADFRSLVDELIQEKRRAGESPGWFQKAHPHAALNAVAYFSMEFMLTEALPIYSGGLGNVAGDQLKTASTFGIPVFGVGLLYQQGYFRQDLDSSGRQRALYPFNDPGQLPIRPLREKNGEWLRFSIAFPGSPLWIRAWQVEIGRLRLYLLDTNDPANTPVQRGITSQLYGGDSELRLKQEIVLGLGGWRLLHSIGLRPEVCHLNEGHAAFAVLERARGQMADHDQPFDLALTVTRAGNLFTTHTPVEAGFDRFAPDLMASYLASYAEHELEIPFDDLLALGRRERRDAAEPFNMAYLGIRGSGAVNGVSRLHGEVSRRIFQPLFPRWPQVEVPVGHVTNGVHMPTWDSAGADRLWEMACGKDRWRGAMPHVEHDFQGVTDGDLWELRSANRRALIDSIREQLARQLAERGASAAAIGSAATMFSPERLTIGFARRFATYKRPNLLLHDADRLGRILTSRQRPVQLVVAGKAHPEDPAGQQLIQQWVEFIRRPDVRGSAVFLDDYDMLMAEQLVQGIDLWINTPRRPWEACGTSGMKVLVNGGLNLSELDGWWAEAYAPEVGWAIGDGRDRGDDPAWDAAEANALYALLEGEVVPAFYTRDAHDIPQGWVARIRESMARLTPQFSTNRTVRQYTEEHYLPAAAAYRQRAAGGGRAASAIVELQRQWERGWPDVRFGSVVAKRAGDAYEVSAEVFLGALNPESVRVEIFADGEGSSGPLRQSMRRGKPLPGSTTGYLFTGRIPSSRPLTDYTPRVIPFGQGVSVPLEAPWILWHDAAIAVEETR